MKSRFYCILLLVTIHGCYTSCNKAKNISPTANEPPVDGTPPPQSNNMKNFVLFHLVRYNNTPASLMPYLYPTKIVSATVLLNADSSSSLPAIRSFAETCPPGVPVTLDLETWPYSPAAELTNTVNDFLTVITDFKSVNVNSPIGFYGVPPKQAYQWSNIDPVNNPGGYANWLYLNNALAPVAAQVNIFLPSFYSYDPDTTSWRKMVDATVAAIKKYDSRKPIYAYIWPQYHQSSTPYNLQFIDTSIWRYELETLYNRVNGCIIWTSNKSSDGTYISWDPNMPWWQTTKSFLVNKGLVPPFVLDSLYTIDSGDEVNIRWATSTDTTTNYFIVQHGADTVNFLDISGHIESIPTHYTENVYQYMDDNPIAWRTYYRLLIVDDKNDTSYSNIVSGS